MKERNYEVCVESNIRGEPRIVFCTMQTVGVSEKFHVFQSNNSVADADVLLIFDNVFEIEPKRETTS